MRSDVVTILVSAAVITLTMGAFVAWVRAGQAGAAGPAGRSRPVTALIVATLVLGTSMTMFGNHVGANSALFAATATLVTLGWTAFVNDVVAMRLPASVRPIRSWELSWHRALGVRAFGRFLRNSPLRHLNPTVYLRAADAEPRSVQERLEVAETVHFWATLFTVPYLVHGCIQGWWPAVGASLVVHAGVNVYPICHLRLARGRLAGYLGRNREAKKTQPAV